MSWTPMILRLLVISVIFMGGDTLTETFLDKSWWFLGGWIVSLGCVTLDQQLRKWDQLE